MKGKIMRVISVDSVKGHELLAKDILNNNHAVLMTAGTTVKREYINRLKELDIEFIYVEDDIAQGINLSDSLEHQIQEQCQDAVREILLTYTYHENSEMEEIITVADEIIFDIMNIPDYCFWFIIYYFIINNFLERIYT